MTSPTATLPPIANVIQASPSIIAAAATTVATQHGNPYASAVYLDQSAYLAHQEKQQVYTNACKATAIAATTYQPCNHFPRLPVSLLPLVPTVCMDPTHRDLGQEAPISTA
ncbi:hypothetical protein H4S07_002878, partial [Coemansia furcata]